MKKYDVITVLDVCVDLIVDCGSNMPKFNQTEQFIDDYNLTLGGSACIFASQIAKLGLNALGIGKVGDDMFGAAVLKLLGDCGVRTEKIETDKNLKTSLSLALCIPNDRAIFTSKDTIDAAYEIDEELIANTKHIHIASYFLTKKMQKKYLDMIKLAKKYNVTVSIDTNYDPDEKWNDNLLEILDLVDIFLPNETEILRITGEETEEKAINKLNVPIIVVKKGKNGSTLYTKEKVINEPMFETNQAVVDAVGAGDSFDGGFIYGYLSGKSLEECMKIGSICGGFNTTKSGGINGQIDIDALNKIIGNEKP